MCVCVLFCFFFKVTATTEIYTLSLHDALPISLAGIGIDATGLPGTEDVGGVLEGAEELEIARLQGEITNSVQVNREIVVELMRTCLASEEDT